MIKQNIDRDVLEKLGNKWCFTDGDKKPRGKDSELLKVNHPEDWLAYEDAVAITSEHEGRFMGVLLDPNDSMVCIDIDKCLGKDGKIKDQDKGSLSATDIRELVNLANSYTEISKSGKGLHIFLQSELDVSLPTTGSPEMYDGSRARFIVVTGNCFEGRDELRTSDEAVLTAIELTASTTSKVQPTVQKPLSSIEHLVVSEFEAVEFALRLLKQHRCDDRSEWFRVMSATKSTLGETGWDLVDEWSKGSASYEFNENRQTWDGMIEDEVRLGTLLFMAKEDTGIQIKIENTEDGEDLLLLVEQASFEIDSIPESVQADWLIEGFIARGHLTLFSGREKSGKSTLIGSMLKAMLDPEGGKFLDIDVDGGKKIMVISEESNIQWGIRRDENDIHGTLTVSSRPFGNIKKQSWSKFCKQFAQKLKRDGYDLLIIDPLANFAPWKDENNAADVGYAMTELNEFAKAGLALLCCHHATKQTGSARGSSALTAAPDINLCLKHTKRKLNNEMVFDFDHTARVLTGNGRFVEIPLSTKLAFDLYSRSYQLRLSDQER